MSVESLFPTSLTSLALSAVPFNWSIESFFPSPTPFEKSDLAVDLFEFAMLIELAISDFCSSLGFTISSVTVSGESRSFICAILF